MKQEKQELDVWIYSILTYISTSVFVYFISKYIERDSFITKFIFMFGAVIFSFMLSMIVMLILIYIVESIIDYERKKKQNIK